MTPAPDPKFFQILPTRALFPSSETRTAPLASRIRATALPSSTSDDSWTELRARVAGVRPDLDAAQVKERTTALRDTLLPMLAENWRKAQRVIAQVAGNTLAISVVGPLSESPAAFAHLLSEIDDEILLDALARQEAGSDIRHVRRSVTEHAVVLETLSSQPPSHIEPALDRMESPSDDIGSLNHACILTVKALVRDRCANLVPPVRMQIENELSFALSATSETTPPTERERITPPVRPSNDVIESSRRAISENDLDTLTDILTKRPHLTPDIVREAITGRNARAITALAWKAGLPAAMASAIQLHMALIPPPRIVLPKADGTYALHPQELNWQLDYLREKCAALSV